MASSRDDIEKRHFEKESEKRRNNAQYYTCKKKYYGYADNFYEYPGKFNACDS